MGQVKLIIVAESPGYSEVDSASRVAKPGHCKTCPLFAKGTGFVHPTMRGAGRPLIGPAGRWLRYKILIPAGIDPDTVLLDNTIRCLYGGVSGGYPKGKEKKLAEAHCRHYDVFSAHPTAAIMLVGNVAASAFYGRPINVGEMHGDIRVHKNRVVGVTFHPAAVLRQANYWPIVTQEFYNLMRAAEAPQILKRPNIYKVPMAPFHPSLDKR